MPTEIHSILEKELSQHERSVDCICDPIIRVMNSGDTLIIHRVMNIRKVSDQLFAAFSDEEDDSIMTSERIIIGLQIIHAYRPLWNSEYHIRCFDNNLYAGELDWEIPDEVKEQLRILGWKEDDDEEMWRADVY